MSVPEVAHRSPQGHPIPLIVGCIGRPRLTPESRINTGPVNHPPDHDSSCHRVTLCKVGPRVEVCRNGVRRSIRACVLRQLLPVVLHPPAPEPSRNSGPEDYSLLLRYWAVLLCKMNHEQNPAKALFAQLALKQAPAETSGNSSITPVSHARSTFAMDTLQSQPRRSPQAEMLRNCWSRTAS